MAAIIHLCRLVTRTLLKRDGEDIFLIITINDIYLYMYVYEKMFTPLSIHIQRDFMYTATGWHREIQLAVNTQRNM